jgi:hypothetical protein
MDGNIPAHSGVEGNVVGVGVPDTLRTYPLGGALIGSPTDRPGQHVVLAWIVHPAVFAKALIGTVDVGQNSFLHGYQVSRGKVQSCRGDAGLLGRKGSGFILCGHGLEVSGTLRHR